jgi:uncharacterized membrane protein
MARLLIVIALLAAAGTAEARPRPGRYNLNGTEPFWGVQLRPGRMHLHDDLADFTVRARGPFRRGRALVWLSAPGNRPWRIELTPGRCDNGMSEHIYRYAARVWIDTHLGEGHFALEGCADPAR